MSCAALSASACPGSRSQRTDRSERRRKLLDHVGEGSVRQTAHPDQQSDVPSLVAVDAQLERDETLAAVWRAIDGLSADLKTALLLRDVVGLSYPEIADALEIPLSTVKWRIFDARERVVLTVARRNVALLGVNAL